jgi:hypothetical protein
MLLKALIGRLFLIYIAIRNTLGYRKSGILLVRIIKWVILVEVRYKRSTTPFSS